MTYFSHPPKLSLLERMRPPLERLCLAGWTLHFMATTILVGLSVEFVIFSIALSFASVPMMGPGSMVFLLCGAAALANFPLVMKFRAYGVANLNFEKHEGSIDRMTQLPQSWSNSVFAILDQGSLISVELEEMMLGIDQAEDAPRRQEQRQKVRSWILEHRAKFNEEDRQEILARLGYMIRGDELAAEIRK